ncbi:hypothetical protein DC345_04185 [Paenibacillus taichungensis]|uniref:Uncharacterized protein n=1 Tax=Paenibacillus taichungensis TaxID=484184 RepID=A0A329R1U2_9BACL|nr:MULTISPECIES: hypothetical protein [Paenibacillus]RAW18343.1 hypothetical protein DC345_04185 [Paenibacillus taichungensis]
MKFRLKITIFAVIIGVLLIPTYFILQTYGVFQKEKVLSDYALAVDVNGKSYEAWPLINSFAAMDKEEDNRQLYYRVDMNHIQYLFHIAYQEFDVRPNEDNPYLAGTVSYHSTQNEYVKSEKQYTNAKDFTTVLNFYNKDKEVIYTYQNTGKGDGQLVQSIIHQGMSRSSNGGSEAARDPYINITALFHDKLDIDVKLEVDEEHKVVTIRMNKAEARS